MCQFYPDICFENFVDVLEFVVGADLINLIQLGLHGFLFEGVFEQGLGVLLGVPGRDH